MVQKNVEAFAVEAPLRIWLHAGGVPSPSRMGVRPSLRPVTLAVTLGPGDQVHLVGDDLYAVRADGVWRASLWPPGTEYARHRETLSAHVSAGALSVGGPPPDEMGHRAAAAARESVVHALGTPTERVVDVSPALALAISLVRDVAERLADAGVQVASRGKEAAAVTPARAVLVTPLGDVAVVANAFGSVMAVMSTGVPCAAGKVEKRERVVRFGWGPDAVGKARERLAAIAVDIADACGMAPTHSP